MGRLDAPHVPVEHPQARGAVLRDADVDPLTAR